MKRDDDRIPDALTDCLHVDPAVQAVLDRAHATAFVCGPSRHHVACDHDGPAVTLLDEDGNPCGESSSCSVCGMSSFDRSFWEGL